MSYQSQHWGDIRTRLQAKVEQKPFWTDAEALLAFNEALLLWNLCTGRWQRRETLLTVANQYLYTCSALMLWRTRMEHNGYPLSPSNREDLNNGRYTWRAETTISGGGVPTRPAVWAPISLQTFYLWPADAVGGNILTIDGVAATPVLEEDADYVDIGDEHLDVLLGYALHQLTFSKGGPYFVATQGLFKAFLSAAAEENDQIKTSKVYRRFMGLDDARGFKLLRGLPTALDQMAGRQP